MADSTGVLARLQAALSLYDPTWDVSVGTATYKILEAVAQEISYANNNSVLQTYSYDVTTKAGSELDNFCNLFGIYRQLGKRASGVVTFSLPSGNAATNIYDIPMGTQVVVPVSNTYPSPIYFATTTPAIIGVGDNSVDVPVIAVLPGAQGNVPATTITSMYTTLNGITTVNNNTPTMGGYDPEGDQALRSRFISTAFNNNIGTTNKYVVTALQDVNVTRASAISQQQFYDEQVQVSGVISGTASTTFAFAFVAYIGATILASGTTATGTTIVAYSGFGSTPSGTAVASGLNTMLSTIAPNAGINVTCTPSGNTTASGFTINFSSASPYRLMLLSGTTVSGLILPNASGIATLSGISYTESVQSFNQDIGVSGTLSFNNNVAQASGYLFPAGNEELGTNLNTAYQITYVSGTDYIYPANPVPQLNLTIANGSTSSGLYIGSQVELISEYNPTSSRSTALASGNFIDIFIDGTTANMVTEQIGFNAAFTLSSGNSTPSLDTRYYILASGQIAASNTATNGDIYVPLNSQPVINFPSQLSTATSGVADTIVVYNATNGTSTTYPIAINPYVTITATGVFPSGYNSTTSGTNFIPIANANTILYPGLALYSNTGSSGSPVSGTGYYVQSVSTSGIYLNKNITGIYTAPTNVAISGRSLVYPIYDITDNKKSVLDSSGLAFDTTTISGWTALPATGNTAWVIYSHSYNQDVVDVESLTQQSRAMGANTLVHQATFINLAININAVLSPGYSASTTQSNIFNQLSGYFAGNGFLSSVTFAGISAQILSAPGVVNAKVTSVNVLSTDGTTVATKTSDFLLASDQLPVLNSVNITFKGASNF